MIAFCSSSYFVSSFFLFSMPSELQPAFLSLEGLQILYKKERRRSRRNRRNRRRRRNRMGRRRRKMSKRGMEGRERERGPPYRQSKLSSKAFAPLALPPPPPLPLALPPALPSSPGGMYPRPFTLRGYVK
jgi:hypothetical protein